MAHEIKTVVVDPGSKAFRFNQIDGMKVLKGAVIAAFGAIFTYISEYVSSTDFGDLTPVVVAVWAVIGNALQKLIWPQSDEVVETVTTNSNS